MLSIKNLLVLAVAATASILPRSAASVKAGLQQINTDTATLTTTINAYNGGGSSAVIPIITAQGTVQNDLKATTTDAKNTGVVTVAAAQDMINYITNTLRPSTLAALTALKSKKSYFTTDGLIPLVQASLQSLQSDTNKLGAAMIAGTPASLLTQAQAIQAQITADFNSAIAFFS